MLIPQRKFDSSISSREQNEYIDCYNKTMKFTTNKKKLLKDVIVRGYFTIQVFLNDDVIILTRNMNFEGTLPYF